MNIRTEIHPNSGLGGFLLRNKITEYAELFVGQGSCRLGKKKGVRLLEQ